MNLPAAIRAFLDRLDAATPCDADDGHALALDFLNRYGRSYAWAPLPPDVPRGPKHECYKNCRRLMLATGARRGWQYVEGIAHAWVADGDTVIDPTYPGAWPKPKLGVAFDLGAVFGIRARVGRREGVLLTIARAFPQLMPELPALLESERFGPPQGSNLALRFTQVRP